jgi:hypothetical protein
MRIVGRDLANDALVEPSHPRHNRAEQQEAFGDVTRRRHVVLGDLRVLGWAAVRGHLKGPLSRAGDVSSPPGGPSRRLTRCRDITVGWIGWACGRGGGTYRGRSRNGRFARAFRPLEPLLVLATGLSSVVLATGV